MKERDGMTPHQQEVYQKLYDGYLAEKTLYERLRELADEQFEQRRGHIRKLTPFFNLNLFV